LRACIARASSAAETGGCGEFVGWADTASHRLGTAGEGVESLGELHHEPAEIIELVLQINNSGGCVIGGCVIGGFGFVTQARRRQLNREAAANGPERAR
jgi:hypothetical protein